MHSWFFRICFFLFIATGVCAVTSAADFRVENRVYSGNKKEPDSQSTTLFHRAFVYDFLQNPAETIVFDKTAGRFVILDDVRQIRTELGTKELENFTQNMKDRAVKVQDPLMQFLADPSFEERYDPSRRELILFSDLVNYRAIVTSADNAVVSQYREFSDWYARLNAILISGSRPPFARLKLNEALARREGVAREVTLTITVVKDGKTQPATVHSEHLLSLTLAPTDMERIDRARKSMTAYKPVSFDQYRQAK
ncbi:MAG: hypothetical protein ABSG67_21230 [Thermoguttaceae bacterium]|jgi:hypothetical protein